MARLLLALLLCCVMAPVALAEDGDPPGEEPAACHARSVQDEDRCEPGGEDGTGGQEPAGGREPEGCDGDDGAGDEPGGGDGEGSEGDELAGEGEDGEGETGEEDEDELGAPIAEAETAPPAPGFRDFCEAPVFDRGLLRRTWRLGGRASGFEGGALAVTVSSPPRVPRRFQAQAQRLVGLELAVVVNRRTKLSRRARSTGRRPSPATLRRARRVRVEGKLLPPSRWRRDADGLRVPTVQARRVTVVR